VRAHVSELRELLLESPGLGVLLPEQAQLQERIDDARDWSVRARAAEQRVTPLAEIQELLTQAETAAVPMQARLPLLEKVQLASLLRQRAAEAFVKDGCQLKLMDVFESDGHYEYVDESGEWSASFACDYCTGNDAFACAQFMIGCDTCKRWFHGPCVSVSKTAADALDDFMCPECATKRGAAYAFGPPLPVPKRTRRPKLRYVTALLAEADEIGVDMPEVAPMRALQQESERWQAEACTLLDVEGDAAEAAIVEKIHLADGLEVTPDSLPPWKRRVERMASWEENVRTLAVVNSSAAALTNAADNLDASRCITEQAATLPLVPHKAQDLREATERGEIWRRACRVALQREELDVREARELLNAVVNNAQLHVSPETELLRLALGRSALMDSISASGYQRAPASGR